MVACLCYSFCLHDVLVRWYCCLSLCFNDTATTEIDTYWTHSFPTRRSSDLSDQGSCSFRRGSRCAFRLSSRRRPKVSGARLSRRSRRASSLRSEEHTSELQSLMRISYAVFCLKKKKQNKRQHTLIHTVHQHCIILTLTHVLTTLHHSQ